MNVREERVLRRLCGDRQEKPDMKVDREGAEED